ncbi:DNA-binding transcriptional regulator GbsR (MarR family) [Friedmanniella endophytica]|uniref:DNA-binding transcriptional regulator GbsR (MarR family) n=1 Tax=Microlunatus kandeliicorticis TaxID=1759536 RepID=A0A7W3IS37_9ACTN|nr:transcriptional regulator [Microlunatus kandeliicorticis]MBA8794196.1 DNA-binding transcriptional regulator GbsR (MarR family) [Microlunatus kandeliicorticis]
MTRARSERPDPGSSGDGQPAPGPPDENELARRRYAAEFGLMWESIGSPQMDGRILGYLMIMKAPYISSAGLAEALNASSGSISMATRRLLDTGFIKRQVVAGDRSHYFRVENDVWGSWLAGERRYFDQERQLIESGLDLLDDGEEDDRVRERLINGRDYFVWLATYHRRMLEDWERYKRRRDSGASEEES